MIILLLACDSHKIVVGLNRFWDSQNTLIHENWISKANTKINKQYKNLRWLASTQNRLHIITKVKDNTNIDSTTEGTENIRSQLTINSVVRLC